jgi:uncharacterized Fe-S cluster-containing radical SAM superfamily protein
MYDPVLVSKKIESIVCSGSLRKYYRFRPAGFYGGIATADCVGCCLRCQFCWALAVTDRPKRVGRLYSPTDVARRLARICQKKGFCQVRLSGNEPTLGREHLIAVLEAVPRDLLFILETNGILIGADPTYAKDLNRYPNLQVRVSLKGSDPNEFQMLTGARAEAFELQIAALQHLLDAGVHCYPAVMASFSSLKNLEKLRGRLGRLMPDFYHLEIEEVTCYPRVQEEIDKAGLIVRQVNGQEPIT